MALSESAPGRHKEQTMGLKVLNIVSEYPMERWHMEPRQVSVSSGSRYTLEGYRTIIEASGQQFVIWLEKETTQWYDNTVSHRSDKLSPYNIRIAREETGESTALKRFTKGSEEEKKFEEIFSKLGEKIAKPSILAQLEERGQIFQAFEQAMNTEERDTPSNPRPSLYEQYILDVDRR